jgi:hypothetical protein
MMIESKRHRESVHGNRFGQTGTASSTGAARRRREGRMIPVNDMKSADAHFTIA